MSRTKSIPTVACICLCLLACAAQSEYPALPEKSTVEGDRFEELCRRVPKLKHERGTRWPMIMWEGISFEPQPPEVYEALLARGLTQHVRMNPKMIPTAKAIQNAGSPVIMMQGKGGVWPYRMAGDKKDWAHDYDEGYEPTEGRGKACTEILSGWQSAAEEVRRTLRQYKEAGVTVDAVWMDWEGEPLGGSRGYQNALHCKRCRRLLPPEVLESREAYGHYCWRLYLELIGTYMSAPAREVFPGCSTTNWNAVFSSARRPVRGAWSDHVYPAAVPPMLTATNPVAYGNTVYFAREWKPLYKHDREHVDQFYFYLLIRQVSDDAANRKHYGPHLGCFPWVVRWCPDIMNPKIPIMSRERYREVLRHIWLRGADGMQIFNASRKGYDELVYNEVVDAVMVYDEMLGHRDFLERGEIMCTDVPDIQDQGVVWSGLRLKDRAVVRAFRPGGAPDSVTIPAWEGAHVALKDLPEGEGVTFLLARDEKSAARIQDRRDP